MATLCRQFVLLLVVLQLHAAFTARFFDAGFPLLNDQKPEAGAQHQQFRDGRQFRHNSVERLRYTDEAEADRVQSLPGWGELDSNIFSGYVTVDQQAQRALFYVYVESTSDQPDQDPLLLWLNGGPGCSSLGGGFLSELGPFLPLPGGRKLQANPYAWNRVANVLFVESPAYVGFSYSQDAADAVVGDARTAADMRKFLLGFIERFPHLSTRDLYLSGESYAGHYLPTLAWEIVQGNRQAAAAASTHTHGADDVPSSLSSSSSPASRGHLSLKGFLVGNPWTDAAVDNLGAVDFWWAHALLSDSTAVGIKSNCNFSRIGPLDAHPDGNTHTKQGACDHFCNVAIDELGPINIYHIYADVCTSSGGARVADTLAAALGRPLPMLPGGGGGHNSAAVTAGGAATDSRGGSSSSSASHPEAGSARSSPRHRRQRSGLATSLHQSSHPNDGDDEASSVAPPYDPCVDDEVTTYLNLPEVQRALHANVSGDLPGPWEDCTGRIMYSREDLLSSMLPVWAKLIATEGLRFMVYSGDVDGIVPVVGTRRWVAGLGLKEVAAWRPWSSGGAHQVGGYVVEYALPTVSAAAASAAAPRQQQPLPGFTFATVRGAGHMVPYVQPQRALHLLAHWLAGQPL